MSRWSEAITRLSQSKKGLTEDSTFLDATIFLSIYEIGYVSTIDRICLLYINNGHDMYDSFHNKFAKDFESIGLLNTSVKFQFLKEHGLGVLIREDDNVLRNKIAHLDFSIEGLGKIRYQSKVINIGNRILELYNFLNDITESLNDALAKCAEDMKRRTEELDKKTEGLNKEIEELKKRLSHE